MGCRIEKVLTRLTRQTWKEALSRLWAWRRAAATKPSTWWTMPAR